MKKVLKYLLFALLGIVLLLSFPAYRLYQDIQKSISEDPLVWEHDIVLLEEQDKNPPGSVVFIGSSSIRFWDSLTEDMAPMKAVNRGFGGAKFGDLVYYADRLVNVEDPLAIVIFVGTNDIQPGDSKEPATLLKSFQKLVANIRKLHRNTPIFYIAITPSPLRWEVWPVAVETNRLIEHYTAGDPRLYFIDTGSSLLKNGVPNEALYRFDGLHLNSSGYAVWTRVIKPQLQNALN